MFCSNDWSHVRCFLGLAITQDHFAATEDEGGKLACFSTGPAIEIILLI
jgi:hypothetical protein